MMKPRLPFFIRYLPIMEILVFVIIGWFAGYGWTLLALVCTSILGIILVRAKGFRMMKEMKENPFVGAPMFISNLQNSIFMLGGLLLIIPGFITDLVGLFCLISPLRRWMFNRFMMMNMKAANQAFSQKSKINQGRTVDGEVCKDKNQSS